LNRLAKADLNWRSSHEVCTGVAPDITVLLIFFFYECIYYLESEIPFPNSREKAGWFIGIAENVGDSLTFWILTEDTEKIIARSVIRTAEDPKTANQRIDQLQPPIKEPLMKVIEMKDMLLKMMLPSIDPDQLIGYAFTAEHAGITQKAEVTEQISDTTYNVEFADGNDDHLTYEEIINMLNREEEEGTHLWTFEKITNHRKTTVNGKQIMEVEVLWDTAEKTDDPVTVAQYMSRKRIDKINHIGDGLTGMSRTQRNSFGIADIYV